MQKLCYISFLILGLFSCEFEKKDTASMHKAEVDMEKNLAFLEELYEDTESEKVLYRLAKNLSDQERYVTSFDYAKKLVKADPKNRAYLLLYCESALNAGKYSSGLKRFKKYMENASLDYQAALTGSRLAIETGDNILLKECTDYLRKYDLWTAERYMTEGIYHMTVKDTSTGVNMLQKSVDKGIKSKSVYLSLVSYYKGRDEDSVSYFLKKASSRFKNDYQVNKTLFNWYLDLDSLDLARKQINIMKSRFKSEEDLIRLSGDLYYQQDDMDKAIQEYEAFIASGQTHWQVFKRLGDYDYYRKNEQKALEHYENALTLQPENNQIERRVRWLKYKLSPAYKVAQQAKKDTVSNSNTEQIDE